MIEVPFQIITFSYSWISYSYRKTYNIGVLMKKSFIGQIVLTIVLISSLGFAQPTIPDGKAGIFLQEFIQSVNSGSQENWQNFCEKQRRKTDDDERVSRRVGLLDFVYNDLGGIELYSITNSSALQLEAVVKGLQPSGVMDYAQITIQLDSIPPHKWELVGVGPADDPTEVFPEGELTAEKIKKYMDGVVKKYANREQFSGTVLIARNGEILYTNVIGEANKRYHVPNKLDTKFNLGSMNKMFTGVATAQLVQNGKLSFNDTVGKHLPDYPNEDVKNKVTIHHLLTHTSGTGDYWEELFSSNWWEIKTVQQLADLTAKNTIEFEPGERFSYSNAGPVILGLIIERISGMSYDEYIRQNITGPAGMINTDCYEVDEPVENLAFGYSKTDYQGNRTERWYNNLFMHAAKGGPAGGGYSTVEDLYRFAQALLSYTLLDKKHFEIVTSGKINMFKGFDEEKYSYLFTERKIGDERIIGHGGGAPGINADLAIYMNSGYIVAVMSNYSNGAMVINNKIERLLLRE